MTEDETERQLRAALHQRAGRVRSRLDGPGLRQRADHRPASRVPRVGPALAAAAVVAVIATVAAVVGSGGSHDPAPVQPGHHRSTVSTPAGTTTAASTTVTTAASPPRPTLVPSSMPSSVPLPRLSSTRAKAPVASPTR